MGEYLIALFVRWLHCMAYLVRPWRWAKELVCCAVDVKGSARIVGCSCGKVFYSKGALADPQVFESWMRAVRGKKGDTWP